MVAVGEGDETKEVATLVRKTKLLKTKMNQAVASYGDLMNAIEGSDPSWTTFAGMTVELKAAKEELDKQKMKNTFWKGWLMSDTYVDQEKKCKWPRCATR